MQSCRVSFDGQIVGGIAPNDTGGWVARLSTMWLIVLLHLTTVDSFLDSLPGRVRGGVRGLDRQARLVWDGTCLTRGGCKAPLLACSIHLGRRPAVLIGIGFRLHTSLILIVNGRMPVP